MKKLTEILTFFELTALIKQYPAIMRLKEYDQLTVYELSHIYIVLNPMCTNERTIDRAILMLDLINSRL